MFRLQLSSDTLSSLASSSSVSIARWPPFCVAINIFDFLEGFLDRFHLITEHSTVNEPPQQNSFHQDHTTLCKRRQQVGELVFV